MIQTRVDASDVIAKHRRLAERLFAANERAAVPARDVVVEEVRKDLASKILAPPQDKTNRNRESKGPLLDAIDGEVRHLAGDTIIGIGNKRKMNEQAVYWRLQDEGGPIMSSPVPGYFGDPSGKAVPFRRRQGGTPTSDTFVYAPGSGSWMWVTSDVRPKHFFDAGDLAARPKVLELFRQAFRSVFG